MSGTAQTGDGRWDVRVAVEGSPLCASVVLARDGRGEVVVVDTGLPGRDGSLLAALAAHGVEARDVTLVLNTHAHVDHSHNNALFTHARILASRRDREWTRGLYEALAAAESPEIADVLPFYPDLAAGGFDERLVRKVLRIEKFLWQESLWGRQDQSCWLEDEPLPAGISLLPTPGHAPYHVSFVFETAGRRVLVAGDALIVRDENDPSLTIIPPANSEDHAASRAAILGFDGIVVPGHEGPFDTGAR